MLTIGTAPLGAAPAADAAIPAGAATPTSTCSPSVSSRAGFSQARDTPRLAPPAALIASTTREPTGRVAIPGWRTLPATSITRVPVGDADGLAPDAAGVTSPPDGGAVETGTEA